MTYNGVGILQLDLMLEMEFIIIQFLNLSLLMVSSILTAPPMLVYQECTSTELTRTHVRLMYFLSNFIEMVMHGATMTVCIVK